MLRLFAAAVAALLLVPTAAPAAKRVNWQQNAYVADRFFAHIGFIPIAGIQPRTENGLAKFRFRNYDVLWLNHLFNRPTVTQAMKHATRYLRFGDPVRDGIYTDRALTARERRSWQVLADIARDADVLVVHRDNPVCASGLTLAQARSIARGATTTWPHGGPIERRLIGYGYPGDRFPEGRFGVHRAPQSVLRADGGVAAARTDRAIAAVTSWSRVRRDSSVCPVALDGIAPADTSVHDLSFPAAYPIQYVMHRKRSKRRQDRAMVAAYVKFLKSARARELFRASGVLLAGEAPAPATGAG